MVTFSIEENFDPEDWSTEETNEETDGESQEKETSDDEESQNDDYEMGSESEEEDEELSIILIIFLASYNLMKMIMELMEIVSQIERPIPRRPITRFGNSYIHRVLMGNPEEFRREYRMYPFVFRKLCQIIRERTPVQDTRFISVEEMLGTFLLIVGQNSWYAVVRDTFGRSRWTISSNFNRMLRALNTLAPQMMVSPSRTTQAKIKKSTRFYPYLKDCIGAMDGTHIAAMVKGRDVSAYRNRKGVLSQNVLAACNFDLEFIYVLSGWEGSAHDSNILNDALTKRNGLTIPKGKFYLVDCGFANRRQFLAPYRGVHYHLQEYWGSARRPVKADELFNHRHASLRNAVERIFGVFKSRFLIFKSAPPFPYKTQAEIVLACAGLHNFLRKECRSDEFPVDESEEEPDNSADQRDPEDNLPQNQTQRQQREDANKWRDSIANKMWDEWDRENES